MSRYPYTYAADFIRNHAGETLIEVDKGYHVGVPKLSRSEASRLSKVMAEAIGLDSVIFSKLLAKAYMAENHIEMEETPPAPALDEEGHKPQEER